MISKKPDVKSPTNFGSPQKHPVIIQGGWLHSGACEDGEKIGS